MEETGRIDVLACPCSWKKSWLVCAGCQGGMEISVRNRRGGYVGNLHVYEAVGNCVGKVLEGSGKAGAAFPWAFNALSMRLSMAECRLSIYPRLELSGELSRSGGVLTGARRRAYGVEAAKPGARQGVAGGVSRRLNPRDVTRG